MTLKEIFTPPKWKWYSFFVYLAVSLIMPLIIPYTLPYWYNVVGILVCSLLIRGMWSVGDKLCDWYIARQFK